jgi:hypothetical protein
MCGNPFPGDGAAAFALANAVPEIVRDVVPRHAAVAATSGTDLLNRVKDVLVPPGFL